MIKKLLLIFMIPFCTISFAQDAPENIDNTWYLHSYERGEDNFHEVQDIQPSISPFLMIEKDLSFTGMAACSEYFGQLSYDINDDTLLIENFDATLNLCDFDSHNSFENDYYAIILTDSPFEYILDEDPSSQVRSLTLFPSSGNVLYYFNVPLGVDEFNTSPLLIYPNPVSETLFISVKSNFTHQLQIYTVTGQLVFSDRVPLEATTASQENYTNAVDVSSLSEGLYFVEVISEEGKFIQKFIKN